MQQEHHPTRSGHETTDADVKPILRFLFGLFALIALVLVGMTFFFDFLHERYEQAATQISPRVDTRQIPPEPRLQVNPAEERKEVRNWEEQRLHSYEWIDKNTGVFRIPIERAMELVAQSGLPARHKAAPDGGSSGGSQ
ncbi:MAG: hypothetical protein P8020_02015 [Acidobacteriota bacterium]|jgi:hypothetical protein